MNDKFDRVAWECSACGHRHAWAWERWDCSAGPIIMECDRCETNTKTELVRIGQRTWAALWGGK